MTSLIKFPLKLSYPIDVDKKIFETIKQVYKKSYNKNRDKATCKTYNDLRTQALGKGVIASEFWVNLLANYYDQTRYLSQKIDMVPKSNSKNACEIKYTWHNAYDQKSDKVVKFNANFEALCTLYNLAALKCELAEVFSENNLLPAVKNFTAAATYFNFLSEAFSGELPVTEDISASTLKAYSSVCLAQAQELILKSPVAEKMKENIKASLAEQAASFYLAAKEKLAAVSPTLKPKSCDEICQAKYYYFKGVANFNLAISIAASQENQGEAIKRSETAKKYLILAQKSILKNFEPVKVAINELIKLNDDNSAQYNKDNDWLYHSAIPKEDELSEISGKAMAKLDDAFDGNSKVSSVPVEDMFAVLV